MVCEASGLVRVGKEAVSLVKPGLDSMEAVAGRKTRDKTNANTDQSKHRWSVDGLSSFSHQLIPANHTSGVHLCPLISTSTKTGIYDIDSWYDMINDMT